LHFLHWWHWRVLRILHSRNVAEADTEVVVAVVPMEEVEEAASMVAVVAADSMEAVAEVIAAEAAERIAAVAVVCIAAADRRVTLLAAWVPMDAAAAAHMAARVRMARTRAARAEIFRTGETAARDRVRDVRIH
jgi:hypothetical protein